MLSNKMRRLMDDNNVAVEDGHFVWNMPCLLPYEFTVPSKPESELTDRDVVDILDYECRSFSQKRFAEEYSAEYADEDGIDWKSEAEAVYRLLHRMFVNANNFYMGQFMGLDFPFLWRTASPLHTDDTTFLVDVEYADGEYLVRAHEAVPDRDCRTSVS